MLRLAKVTAVLGFITFMFGGCCMDSESLLIPSLMVLGGLAVFAFSAWVINQYVEV